MQSFPGFAGLKLLLYKGFPESLPLNHIFYTLGVMCIVRPDGPPQLCRTDEIGEICVSSRTGGMMYFGLAGVTKNTFEVHDMKVLGETYLMGSGYHKVK